MNEIYSGLIGKIVGKFWYGVGHWDSEGTPGQVAFDYNLVMEREEKSQDVVGFFHTHPMSFSIPSPTDYATMGAWTVAFGKPLVCCIKGTNGLSAHWFLDDESKHITASWMRKFGDLYIGRVPRQVKEFMAEKKKSKKLQVAIR